MATGPTEEDALDAAAEGMELLKGLLESNPSAMRAMFVLSTSMLALHRICPMRYRGQVEELAAEMLGKMYEQHSASTPAPGTEVAFGVHRRGGR